MPTARIAPAPLAILFAAGIAGCSVSPPRFHVVEATVGEVTDDGFVVNFTLEGENNSASQLPVRDVSYRVELAGQKVFEGRRSGEVTLPRRGSQRLTLPAAVSLERWRAVGGGDSSAAVGAPFVIAGEIAYLSPGALAEILFDVGVRRPTVSLNEAGVVSAPEPPAN